MGTRVCLMYVAFVPTMRMKKSRGRLSRDLCRIKNVVKTTTESPDKILVCDTIRVWIGIILSV